MDPYDALIVGGGPAGSSCAWALSRAGLRVAVLDKAPFPRDKLCAGWITPPVFDELGVAPEEYALNGRVLQPIAGFVVGGLGSSGVAATYDGTVSYAIRRCELDEFLLRRSGADLLLAQALTRIERTAGRWIVNRGLEAPLLVGAGGHFCPVARYLGATPGGGERAVVAQEIEVELTTDQQAACDLRGDLPELFFCRDLRGYGWCVRKGSYLNLGLGRQDPRQLSRHVASFVVDMKRCGKIASDVEGSFGGHAYLLASSAPRRLLDDGVLLVGDAAGLAYPTSGEGIRPAVESGLLAAQVVLEANGDYRRPRLEPYRQWLRTRFGRHEGDRDASLRRFMPESLFLRLAGRLLANPRFARQVVVDRWFLRRHDSALGLGPPRAAAPDN